GIGEVAFEVPARSRVPASSLCRPFLLCSRQTICPGAGCVKIVLQPIVQLATRLIFDCIQVVLKDIRIVNTFLFGMFAQPLGNKVTDNLSGFLFLCGFGGVYLRLVAMLQEPSCLVVTG